MPTIQVYDGSGIKPAPAQCVVHLDLATPWRWFGRTDKSLDGRPIPASMRDLRFYPVGSPYDIKKLMERLTLALDRPGSTIDLSFEAMPGKPMLSDFGQEKYGPFTLRKVSIHRANYIEGRRCIFLTYTRDPLAGEPGYTGDL